YHSGAQSRKQDNKTKKEAKGKSPVESFIGYRDLSAEFEDCSDNNINEFNGGTIVPTVEQNSLNSTNTFSAAELEDITYSDDKDDVGAEADFNNLETSITISPILTTRVHKDHPISQIIGDLSSTTQTTSMTRMVKDQDGLLQMFNDDFHTCMFVCFLLQEEPKREYVVKILRKFGLTKGKSASTPIDTEKPLLKDPDGDGVDVYTYRLMIGSLMYLTSSRPDSMFAVGACARFQVAPKASHIHAVKSIFRYLKGKPYLGLWYPKDSPFDLVAYSDSDYAGASLDRKSTTGGCQFLGFKQVNDVTWLQALVDKKKVVVTEATIREALRLDDAEGVDCLSNKEIFAELARIGYEKPSTKLTSSMASAVICLSSGRKFNFSKYIFDSLNSKLMKNEMQMRMLEKLMLVMLLQAMLMLLMEKFLLLLKNNPFHLLHHLLHHHNHLKISLQHPRVEHLEFDKVAQALEITKFKGRVKKLEKRNKGRMIAEMDQDNGVVLEDDKEEDREVDDAVKIVKDAKEDETEPAKVQEVVDVVTTAKLITEVVTAASETITAASAIITTAEAEVPAATLTAALARVVAAPSRRRKGVVIRDPESESTTSTIIPAETKSKDKELHAELNKDIDWDKVIDHVKIKAKEDPAVKKYQALKRKPQTKSQARMNMILYLKNVDGFKMDYFKGMSYDDIRPIFKAKFNSNVAFLLKTKKQIKEDENRALQKLNETPA
nr:hypothetical protein [Tanacetum cinerariifolium]